MKTLSSGTKRGLFVVVSLILVTAARTADIAATMYYCLDLSNEANPLVSQLGLGWAALITANILVLLLITGGAIYWWKRPLVFDLPPEVINTWGFASYCWYQKVYTPRRFFLYTWYKIPRRLITWRHFLQMFGFVMPITIIVVSVAAVFSWIMTEGYSVGWYINFYNATFPIFPYALLIPPLVIMTVIFYRSEYRRSQTTVFSEEVVPIDRH